MTSDAPLIARHLYQVHWEELPKHRMWYLVLGILLILSGVIAISFYTLATVVSMIFIGVQLLLSGILLVVLAFKVQRWGGFFLELLIGVLYTVTGGLIIANPGAGALALTLLIAMFLLFEGIFRIVISLIERPPHWGWVFVLGVVNVLLGVMIWRQWPVSGLWLIGLFVGIEMLFNGWTLVMLSTAARHFGAETGLPKSEPAGA